MQTGLAQKGLEWNERYWFNEGLFGHYEDFVKLDDFKAKWGYETELLP